MADPFTLSVLIISIISSTASFSAQTSSLARKLKRSDHDIQTQVNEIKVMCEVLEECHDIVRASENVSIPPSVDRALHICLDRYTNLMALVERLRIDKLESRSLFTKWHQIVTEPERKAAFDAFRNSVMLLRDLCSDLRLRQQLVNMSTGLTQLMIDYSEGEETMEPSNTRPGHIHIGEDDTEGIPRLVEDPQLTELTKGSKKSGSVGRVLQELIKQNFTRNATIVLDSSMGTFSEHVRYIHVRAKMDTGCNENLITMATIEKAGIDGSRLLEIPEDEKIEFHGVESAKCSPLYQIDLIWYQDGDPQMRRDARFYVVKEGPFDILLGSQRFAQDLDSQGNPILVVATREKRKDRKKRQADHQQHLQRQRSQEDRERAARASGQASAQGQPHGQPHGQP